MRSIHCWDFCADLFSTATLTALRSTISWRPIAMMSGEFEPSASQDEHNQSSSPSWGLYFALTFHVPRKIRSCIL